MSVSIDSLPDPSDMAEEQYIKAKTSIWWDIENCHVPKVCDTFAIAQNINSALSKMNYSGPVSISAYGDTNRIPPNVQQALSSTGISLNHVPAGVKDASDKKILVDMLFWAVDNPAPANYLLISGDRDFSNALHQLRLRRYNILLAQPTKASAALVAAAKSVWLWTSLLAGGGPISKTESLQIVNNADKFPLEADQVSEPVSGDGDSSAVGNQKFISPSKGSAGDLKYKVKNLNKNLNQPSLAKAQSMPMMFQESKIDECIPQPEYAQGRVYTKAPRDHQPHFPSSSWTAPNNYEHNATNANSFKGTQQSRYPYPAARPRGLTFPAVVNSAPGHLFRANAPNPAFQPTPFRPDRPTLTPSAANFSTPNVGKQNMSAYPTNGQLLKEVSKLTSHESPHPTNRNQLHKGQNGYMNSTPYRKVSNRKPLESSSVLVSGGPFVPPSEEELELIGLVLHTLDCLKNDKISPVEANIVDCIRLGNPKYHNTDVKSALDVALKRQMIIRQALGDLQVYLGSNQKLWSCVNPIGGNPNQYSKAIWLEIHKFITSPEGQSAICTSSCKYEAALILKRLCVQDLPLGDVLCILNMLAGPKQWIKHNPSGWQPVFVTATTDFDDVKKEANKSVRKVVNRYIRKAANKEVAKEASNETSKEAREKVSTEASSEVSKEASEDSSLEASKEASEDSSSDVSKEASLEARKEESEDSSVGLIKDASSESILEASTEATKEASEEVSTEVSKEAIEDSSSDVSKEASLEASKEAIKDLSVGLIKDASSESIEKASTEATKEASEEVSTEVSKEASGYSSLYVSKVASLEARKEASEDLSVGLVKDASSESIEKASTEATKEVTGQLSDLVGKFADLRITCPDSSGTKSVDGNFGDEVAAGRGEVLADEIPCTDIGTPVLLPFQPFLAKFAKACGFRSNTSVNNRCKDLSKKAIQEVIKEVVRQEENEKASTEAIQVESTKLIMEASI